MSTDRDSLTKRSIPYMTLGSGKEGTPSGPPPSLVQQEGITPAERAAQRFSLADRNAVVTGGLGDLGYTACQALLEHGLKGLAIFDMFDAGHEKTKSLLANLQSKFPDAGIHYIQVNVTNEDQVVKAVSKAQEIFQKAGGKDGINILVNFAGIVSCQHAEDVSKQELEKVFGVNTMGAFLVARECFKAMKPNGGGSIVLIASMSSHQVNFPQPQVAYNLSKAAVRNMARSLAAEWAAYGVRVNSLSPGYMDTILNDGDLISDARDSWNSRNPMGRMGTPDELTGAVVMLASRAGSYITGADLIIDGGQTLLL